VIHYEVISLKMAPKWWFDVDTNRSVDSTKWILKYYGGGSQDSSLASWPSGQSKRGVSRLGASAPCQSSVCQMSKYPTGYDRKKFWNIALDS